MYQGSNPSAIRSRNEIVKAFLDLLAVQDLDAISIKQIMDATDLSRQTFYQIFDSKEEILEYYLDVLFDRFMKHSRGQTIKNLCDAAKLFFSFFEDYRDVLALFIRNGKSCVVQRKCREYLQQEHYVHYALAGVRTPQEQSFATTFAISGMVAVLEQWIREPDCGMTAQDLALLVCRITGTQ
ncbi:MAG: TetR/AcrR family transcriptional regulator [Pseudoramibacter sp.]